MSGSLHEAVYVPYTQAGPEDLGQMNIVVRTAESRFGGSGDPA